MVSTNLFTGGFKRSITLKPSTAHIDISCVSPKLTGYQRLLPVSEVQVTAEMVGALSRLQVSLKTVNVGLKVVEENPDEGDLLVLGTFVPSEDIAKFSDTFNLTIDAAN